MSLKKLISAVVFATLATASMAQAAIVPMIDIGDVVDGETGQFVMTGRPGSFLSQVKGNLANNLRIDFEYSINTGSISYIANSSTYDYISGHHYEGNRYVDTFGTVAGDEKIDGVAGAPQRLFATANLSTPTTGTSSVLNVSGGVASFLETLSGLIAALGNKTLTIKYVVSSVPLPAMAPLFGAALAGLGFAARRKAKASA